MTTWVVVVAAMETQPLVGSVVTCGGSAVNDMETALEEVEVEVFADVEGKYADVEVFADVEVKEVFADVEGEDADVEEKEVVADVEVTVVLPAF